MKYIFILLLASITLKAQVIRYVKPTASGTADGTSWADASDNIQTMLNTSSPNDEVWVAAGTYRPDTYPPGCDSCFSSRFLTFFIPQGISLIGGFTGNETAKSQRNILLSETILEADNNTTFNGSDDLLHVVMASNADNGSGVTIDGFTVKGGDANLEGNIAVNGNSLSNDEGGGIVFIHGDNRILNCKIQNNYAARNGGGIYNYLGKTRIENSSFISNESGYGGGALLDENESTVINCTFSMNLVVHSGGGMSVVNGTTTISGTTIFDDNEAKFGGGLYLDGGVNQLNNTTFSNNLSNSYGGGLFLNYATVNCENCTFFSNASGGSAGACRISYGDNTFTNCHFEGNTDLGGMVISGGNNIIISSKFIDNEGAINAQQGKVTIERTLFLNNIQDTTRSTGGGACLLNVDTLNFKNNLLIGNAAGNGGAIWLGSGTSDYQQVVNNTFFNNRASMFGGAMYTRESSLAALIIDNNIFRNNRQNGSLNIKGSDIFHYFSPGTFTNNALQLPDTSYTTSGTGNYDLGVSASGNLFGVDPMFQNTADFDGADNTFLTPDDGFLLQSGSSLINYGTPTNAPNDDIRGMTREGKPDLGAYEFYSNPCPDNLMPTGLISMDQKANLSIQNVGNNTINLGISVIYQAGNYIQLNPGFSTGTNSVFMTKLLSGCQ